MANLTKTDEINLENPLDNVLQKFDKWMNMPKSYGRRLFPIFIAILIVDLLENFVSGATSYGWVTSNCMVFLSESTSSIIAIIWLTVFEAFKVIVYFSFFYDLLKKDVEVSKTKFVLLILLTAASVYQTKQGATDLVYNYSSPPKMVEKEDLASFYYSELESIQSSIQDLENKSDPSIVLVVKKGADQLRKKKDLIRKKLEKLEGKRIAQNETIMVQSQQTLHWTKDNVFWFAIALNILSAFFFSPVMANYWIKASSDYKRLSGNPTATPQQPQDANGNTKQIRGKPSSKPVVKTSKKPSKTSNPTPESSNTDSNTLDCIAYCERMIADAQELILLEQDVTVKEALKAKKVKMQQQKSKFTKDGQLEETTRINIEKAMKEALQMAGK